MTEIIKQKENIDSNSSLNKEAKEVLKMLDTKEGKDEFIKELFASKEYFTETFWKHLFIEQFGEREGVMLVNALLKFCKNIDIKKFSNYGIEEQYRELYFYLKGLLGNLNLYREIELINAYINYDLKPENTIKIEEILSSASEKQLTKNEALEHARLARFAYADVQINKIGELSFLDNYQENKKEILDLFDLSNGDIKFIDIPIENLSFNQLMVKEFLTSNIEGDFYVNSKVENGKIIIKCDEIPQDIKEIFSGKINYKQTNDIDTKYACLVLPEKGQLDALIITEQTTLLHKILSLFKKYDKNKNILNYKKDYDEVIKGKYNFIEQINDKNSGLSVILLENKKTKDLVLSIRGTNDLIDIMFSNIQLVLTEKQLLKYSPLQIKALQKVFLDIDKKYKGKNIKILGHSLGGYLSEISESFDLNLNIETINFNGPGGGNLNIKNKENIGKNTIKFSTNETISNFGTKTNKFLVPLPGDKHSIDSVIDNISKNIENEKHIPIIDIKKLKDVF